MLGEDVICLAVEHDNGALALVAAKRHISVYLYVTFCISWSSVGGSAHKCDVIR